ncbi:hypothetical protein [Streptomyces sp. YKOK-J1]
MKFKLKYPPLAANGPEFAADIVGAARDISGAELDYSVQSLVVADELIHGIRAEGAPIEAVGGTLFGFGAYLGQVMLVQADMRWVDFDDRSRERFGHAFGVAAADGSLWNPLAKGFDCFAGEDSLHSFYRVACA